MGFRSELEVATADARAILLQLHQK